MLTRRRAEILPRDFRQSLQGSGADYDSQLPRNGGPVMVENRFRCDKPAPPFSKAPRHKRNRFKRLGSRAPKMVVELVPIHGVFAACEVPLPATTTPSGDPMPSIGTAPGSNVAPDEDIHMRAAAPSDGLLRFSRRCEGSSHVILDGGDDRDYHAYLDIALAR